MDVVSAKPDESPSKDAAASGAPPPQLSPEEEESRRQDAEREQARKDARAGRPKHYDIDVEILEEMVERRNMDTFETKFGALKGISEALQTSLDGGIDSSTIPKRKEQFGENVLSKKEPVTFLEFVIDAFQDRIVQILTVAAVISIIFGMTLPDPYSGRVEYGDGWINGTAILISETVVILVGSINNYSKAKKFEEMEKEQSIKALSVFRDGKELTINSDEIVVGDILVLETGMEMVCDALAITTNDLKTNESAITGEPDLIEKSLEKDAFIISGTCIEEGDGKVLVIAVGMDSFQGKMKAAIDEESGETPLQEHLDHLAGVIGKFGLGGAVILIVALTIKEIILITTQGKIATAISFLNFFLMAITLIAVAIPEGLSLAVTIALSYSMHAMMQDNCMVRVLASCETMGAATAICSDKTGTLTTNRMTAVQGVLCEEEFLITGYGIAPRHDGVTTTSRDNFAITSSPKNIERMAFALSINSTAREQMIDGELKWVGNKTEAGMLKVVKQFGLKYEDMRASVEHRNMRMFPFSSTKKRMTTIVRTDVPDANGNMMTMYCKGASEAILESCDRYLDRNGAVHPMQPMNKQLFDEQIVDMANQGNRTIGVAFTPLKTSEVLPEEEPDQGLIFIGVLGIQDPIREEVPNAVLGCQSAKLVIRMVTGDNINTAIAIAKKCYIYTDNGFDLALTGQGFRDMFRENRSKLEELLPRLRVLARSSPQDKYILVDLLKEAGEVVGVTGDGSNDAPALKLAHVGFAMKTGTDIAKGAADMVLLDDNFATVVKAIKWGRAVNDNVRKFLQFQLTINMSGVFLTLIVSLASTTSKAPFTPVQLLWLNLIMDTLAAIALSTELPEEACLQRNPVYLQAPIITNKMALFMLFHAIFQFILIIVLLWEGHKWFNCVDGRDSCRVDYPDLSFNGTTAPDPRKTRCQFVCKKSGGVLNADKTCQQGDIHSTIVFNIYILIQVFNVINARKMHGEVNPFEGIISRSINLLRVFGIILLFQIFAVEVAGSFMKTVPLLWWEWLVCVGISLSVIPLGFIPRLIPIKDVIPEIITDKAVREQKLREQLQEEAERKPALKRDPSLRRSSLGVNKRRNSSGH